MYVNRDEIRVESNGQVDRNVSVDRDNTGINVRDRDDAALTPFDQSESKGDILITKNIRHAIVADDSLSMYAKNIKIITDNGNVTLRGPVSSETEKAAILKIVNNIGGIKNVNNQLEVAQ